LRSINDKFINDLLDGELSFFLDEIKAKRDLLSLEIRRDYINIYYRGGNIVRISQSNNRYYFFFDVKYCRSEEYKKPEDNPHYQTLASMDKYDAQAFINNLPVMRIVMDAWFKKYPKKEREFQQNLQSENAFVIDIEHQVNYDCQGGMRFDMIIVDGDKMYVTENKVGTSAIGGNAGVVKHYNDICEFLDDERLHQGLVDSVIETSKVKHKLGLLEGEISYIDPSKTEILFVFGEYNRRSKALGNAVKEIHKHKGNYSKVYPVTYLMPEKEDYKICLENAKDLYAYEN
jgi:hypothetical protein